MAFLLAEAVGAIGATVSSSLAELGLGSTISTAAGGLAVSQTNNFINEGINSAAETVIGKENLEKVKSGVNRTVDQSTNAAYSLIFQDPFFLTKQNQNGDIQYRFAGEPNINEVQAQQQQPQSVNIGPINPFVTGQQNINNQQPTQPTQSSNNQNVINTNQPIINKIGKKDTNAIADLIVSHTSEIANGIANGNNNIDPGKTLEKVIGGDREKLNLSEKLSSYYSNKNVPTNDYYKSIEQVYNGRDLNYPFVEQIGMVNYRNIPLKVFGWKDETGQSFTLRQTIPPPIPALYGNFGGPSSPNNALPIDLADSFFAMHDESYHREGFGTIKGDYQLVARLSNNLARLNPDSLNFFNATILYFSTVANTLYSLKGSLDESIVTKPSETIIVDDFFGKQNVDLANNNPTLFKQEQHEFYKELVNDFEESYTQSSMFAQASTYRQKALANDFGNIMVQLL